MIGKFEEERGVKSIGAGYLRVVFDLLENRALRYKSAGTGMIREEYPEKARRLNH